MDKETFGELIKQVRRGDEEAFEQLFHAYKTTVIGIIYNFGIKENFEDVAQRTWFRFYNSIWQYIEILPGLLFWQYGEITHLFIFKIARNEALRYLEEQKRNPAKPPETEISEFEGLEKDENIIEALERQRRRKQLIEYINQLPSKYYEVIILADVHDHNYEEIAKILGISLNNVRTRVHRGRKILRKLLFGKEL